MAIPRLCCIYCITDDTNGKKYVGQARDLRSRWRFHRNSASGKPNQSYSQRTAIARTMRKRGVEHFTLSILEICEPDMLDQLEAQWIERLGTLMPAGYNLTAGGRSSLRAAVVGQQISLANKGRVKTPEWRAKLSAAHKGKIISPEQRAKARDAHLGVPESAESSQKKSLALKGRKLGSYSAARCDAISAGMSKEGHKRSIAASHTPEVEARRSVTRTGQKRTPEQCARMSAGQRRRALTIPKEQRVAMMNAVRVFRPNYRPTEEVKRRISETLKARNAALRSKQPDLFDGR